MDKLIEWWARNTVAANLLMLGIFAAGIFGFNSMEREFPLSVVIRISWSMKSKSIWQYIELKGIGEVVNPREVR